MWFKKKLVNGHTKQELKRHRAGKFIPDPNVLSNGTEVMVCQKGTLGCCVNGDGWWERCTVCGRTVDGVRDVILHAGDGIYKRDEAEVYELV